MRRPRARTARRWRSLLAAATGVVCCAGTFAAAAHATVLTSTCKQLTSRIATAAGDPNHGEGDVIVLEGMCEASNLKTTAGVSIPGGVELLDRRGSGHDVGLRRDRRHRTHAAQRRLRNGRHDDAAQPRLPARQRDGTGRWRAAPGGGPHRPRRRQLHRKHDARRRRRGGFDLHPRARQTAHVSDERRTSRGDGPCEHLPREQVGRRRGLRQRRRAHDRPALRVPGNRARSEHVRRQHGRTQRLRGSARRRREHRRGRLRTAHAGYQSRQRVRLQPHPLDELHLGLRRRRRVAGRGEPAQRGRPLLAQLDPRHRRREVELGRRDRDPQHELQRA